MYKVRNITMFSLDQGTSYKNWALRVDRFSRVYFPLSFLIFNLIYWPFFVYKQQIVTEELKNTFNVD